MTANTNPIFIKNRKNWPATIDNAAGTTPVALVAGGQDGSLVESISIVSTDTVSAVVVLSINDGSTSYDIGALNVPPGAGSDGTTPSVSGLDQAANPWITDALVIPVEAGHTLQAAALVAVGAGNALSIVASGGDY